MTGSLFSIRRLFGELVDTLISKENPSSPHPREPSASSDRGYRTHKHSRARRLIRPHAHGEGHGAHSQNHSSRTPHSPEEQHRIFVDAAFRRFDSGEVKAGIGIYYEDAMTGLSLPIRAKSSAEAEAVGVWIALGIARRRGLHKPKVICDCSSVVDIVGSQREPHGKWRRDQPHRTPLAAVHISSKARDEKKRTHAEVVWEEREQTRIAHLLAALASRNVAAGMVLSRGKDGEKELEDILSVLHSSERTEGGQQKLDNAEFQLFSINPLGLAWQDWNTDRTLDDIVRLIFSAKPDCTSELAG